MGYTHVTAAWPTTHQTMTTDTPSIPVGIDGEAAELITPLEFTHPSRCTTAAPTPCEQASRTAVLPAMVTSRNHSMGVKRSQDARRCAPAGPAGARSIAGTSDGSWSGIAQ
jgi:hypothetical protein